MTRGYQVVLRKIRALHAEDDPQDAELICSSLEEQGIAPDIRRVETLEGFMRALEEGSYDLIISDFTMPAFDGLKALKIAREKSPGTPFIYVSGTIGEERAVEALRNGAIDYVLKDKLFKLGPAVEHALRESALRSQRQQAEEQLHKAHHQLQRTKCRKGRGSSSDCPRPGKGKQPWARRPIFRRESEAWKGSSLWLQSLQTRIQTEKVQLVLGLAETPPVQGNEARWRFVASSIIGNALDSLQDRTVRLVTVRTGSASDSVYFEVEDSGCGISEEDLPRIFSPFFSAKGEWAPPSSPQAKLKGVGLSLAISSTTVSEYGGRIEVRSTKGAGSTFRVVMPFAG